MRRSPPFDGRRKAVSLANRCWILDVSPQEVLEPLLSLGLLRLDLRSLLAKGYFSIPGAAW